MDLRVRDVFAKVTHPPSFAPTVNLYCVTAEEDMIGDVTSLPIAFFPSCIFWETNVFESRESSLAQLIVNSNDINKKILLIVKFIKLTRKKYEIN